MPRELFVLALVKDEKERYIFFYDDESSDVLINVLGQFAMDRELSFTRDDALNLRRRVSRLKEESDRQVM